MTAHDLEIEYGELPTPGPSEVIFTRNANPEDIRFLLCASHGQRLYSRDLRGVPNEDIPRVQATLNGLAARPDYHGEFTSLAARISQNHPRQSRTLNAYGYLVLVADTSEIGSDTVIFNGDFQNIGTNRIRANGVVEGVRTWQATENLSQVADDLEKAMTNHQRCEYAIIGQYFEARLYRALVPTDLIKIYAPGADESVKKELQQLAKLRRDLLDSH